MENKALSEATSAAQVVYSKKRPRIDGALKKQTRSDRMRDPSNHNELFALREALKAEKRSLQRLYSELEAERGASMTAANEAIAMINRLQEEKAAVLVEARRYKLEAEEREIYNQEAIFMLKEALLFREDELLALQDLLSTYKEKLMQIEIGQQQYLEDSRHNGQLLFLPNSTTNASSIDSKRAIISHGHDQICSSGLGLMATANDHEYVELQKEVIDTDLRTGRKYEKNARQCWHTEGSGGTQGNNYTLCDQRMFQSSMLFGDNDAESKTPRDSQEEPVDDVSNLIFARVKRLEERFQRLGQNQTFGHQQLGFTCHSNTENLCDLDSQERTKAGSEATSKAVDETEPKVSMQSDGLYADDHPDSDLDIPDESWKHLPFEKVTPGIRNEALEHGWAVSRGDFREDASNAQHVHHEQSALSSVMSDVESEGVHDVYEVQSDVKHSYPDVKHCSKDDLGHYELEMESRDASMHGMVHGADKYPIEVGSADPGKHADAEACLALAGKLSINAIPADSKAVYANGLEDDVQQLKLRLQALEGERVFMKDAIFSLRKENKELKVLQELAYHLEDLKLDVRRNEGTGQQGHPSVFDFFKGLFSFIGRQPHPANRSDRCLLQSCSISTNRRQDGLRHILDEGSAIADSTRVNREHKVKLNHT